MYTKEQVAQILNQHLNANISPDILCDACLAEFEKQISEFKASYPACDLEDETTWTEDCVQGLNFYLTEVADFIKDMQTQNAVSERISESKIIGTPIFMTRGGYATLLGKYLPSGAPTGNVSDDELTTFNNSFKTFLKENPGLDPLKGNMTDKQMVDLVKIIKESRKITESKSGVGIGSSIDAVLSGKSTVQDIEKDIDAMNSEFPAVVKQALKYATNAQDKFDIVHDFWAEGVLESTQDETQVKESLVVDLVGMLNDYGLFDNHSALAEIITGATSLKGAAEIVAKILPETAKSFFSKFTPSKLADLISGVKMAVESKQLVKANESVIDSKTKDKISKSFIADTKGANLLVGLVDDGSGSLVARFVDAKTGGDPKNPSKDAKRILDKVMGDFGFKEKTDMVYIKEAKIDFTKGNKELKDKGIFQLPDGKIVKTVPAGKSRKGKDMLTYFLFDGDNEIGEINTEIDNLEGAIDQFKKSGYVKESRVDENKILKCFKVYVTPTKANAIDGHELAKKLDGQYNGTAMERSAPDKDPENYHLITTYIKKSEVKDKIPNTFQLVEESKIITRKDAIIFRSKFKKINESKAKGSELGIQVGTKVEGVVNGKPRRGVITKIDDGTQMAQADFGGGDKIGIAYSRFEDGEFEISESVIESSMGDVLVSRDTKDVQAYKHFVALQEYLESKYKTGKDYDITADGSIRIHQAVVDKDSKLKTFVDSANESMVITEAKWSVTGGPLGEPYNVDAKDKNEAIQKALDALKPIFGSIPKNRLSAEKLDNKMNEHHLIVGDKVEVIAGDHLGKKGEVSGTSEDGLTYTVNIEGQEVQLGDSEVQKEQIVEEGYEVHYSDGVRAMKKFADRSKAMDFAKDLTKKSGMKEISVFNAGSGFHSTTQDEFLISWWGNGSYWDNKSQKDSNLSMKKLSESADAGAKEGTEDSTLSARYANVTEIVESEDCTQINDIGVGVVLENTAELSRLMSDIRSGEQEMEYDATEIMCVEDDIYNHDVNGIRYVIYTNPTEMEKVKTYLTEKGYSLTESPIAEYLKIDEGSGFAIPPAARDFITSFVNQNLKDGDIDSKNKPRLEVIGGKSGGELTSGNKLVLRNFGTGFKALLDPDNKKIYIGNSYGNISQTYANAVEKDAKKAGYKVGTFDEDGTLKESYSTDESGTDDIEAEIYEQLRDLASTVDIFGDIKGEVVSSEDAATILELADDLNEANRKQLLALPTEGMVDIATKYKLKGKAQVIAEHFTKRNLN